MFYNELYEWSKILNEDHKEYPDMSGPLTEPPEITGNRKADIINWAQKNARAHGHLINLTHYRRDFAHLSKADQDRHLLDLSKNYDIDLNIAQSPATLSTNERNAGIPSERGHYQYITPRS